MVKDLGQAWQILIDKAQHCDGMQVSHFVLSSGVVAPECRQQIRRAGGWIAT